jgi:hypothetical protein
MRGGGGAQSVEDIKRIIITRSLQQRKLGNGHRRMEAVPWRIA